MNVVKPKDMIILIDANNTCFRVGWANKHLTNNGEPTGVIYGFLREILGVWERWKHAKIGVIWDCSSEYRMNLSKEGILKGIISEEQGYYKQNRERQRNKDEEEGKINEIAEAIEIQKPTLKELLSQTLVHQIKIDGFEADDLIGTLATMHAERGDVVKIISSDKDMYQLLSDQISIFSLGGKNSMTYERFAGEFGISPAQWIDVGAMAGDKCFTGDTKIKLLNGQTKTMKELAENFADSSFWVYSCDQNGKIVPGKASKPKRTIKNAPIVKITLDNGEVIRCTPDHRFMLKSGEYKEAKNLTTSDSLMPLYYRQDPFGYEEVLSNFNKRWYKTHRIARIGKCQCETMNSDPEMQRKQLIGRIKKVAERAIEKSGEVSEASYKESRRGNDPTWETATRVMGMSVCDINHKIVSVEFDGVADVYDFKVDEYHNFALDCGVFVHNSDNIHGVSGIGEKTAIKMLVAAEKDLKKEEGSTTYIDILNHLKDKDAKKRKKKEQNVINSEEILHLAYKLKKIITDANCPEYVTYNRSNPNLLRKMLADLGFKSIIGSTGLLTRRAWT